MANYYTNDDGLVRRFGTFDTVTKPVVRVVPGNGLRKTLVVDFDFNHLGATVATWFTQDVGGGTTPDSPSGENAFIPNGSLIESAKLMVKTAWLSSDAATMNIGLYERDNTVIDADGIDAVIAVGALTADTDIACDGADIGTVTTADAYIGADWDDFAWTAGTARLLVEFIPEYGS